MPLCQGQDIGYIAAGERGDRKGKLSSWHTVSSSAKVIKNRALATSQILMFEYSAERINIKIYS